MRLRVDAVMTIAQARELLGDEALSMTDEEIQQMIDGFDIIAQFAIKEVSKFKNTPNKSDI